MNDIQLYNLYLSIALPTIYNRTSKIYPKYVVITGLSMVHPHPCRHFSFSEFVDKLEENREEIEKLLIF